MTDPADRSKDHKAGQPRRSPSEGSGETLGPDLISAIPAPRFATRTLSHRKATRFDWRPDAAARRQLAAMLDLPAIAALRLKGEITPEGRDDFRLSARLEADVTQACVISLEPVPARLGEDVLRRYIADWQEDTSEEVEIPEDDSAEPMPEVIDIAEVTREALSLALPPYPRAEGAALGEAVFAGEGAEALRDQDLRPFAGLAALLSPQDGENTGGTAGDLGPKSAADKGLPKDGQ